MKTSFIFKLINMGYLSLLATASFVDLDGGQGPLSTIAFFPNGHSDFSQRWYQVTGNTIFHAMLLGLFKHIVYITRDKIYFDFL